MFRLSCLLFFVIISITCRRPPVSPSTPNILFILADDWSYPYVGYSGWTGVATPHLDSLAKHGSVFENAFCVVPSCTPSRSALLTGSFPHRLGEAVNLCGRLDDSIPTYVQALRQIGYKVAYDGKGWAPGDFTTMGYTQNPCGDHLTFTTLLDSLTPHQPFFFWYGSPRPHRPFKSRDTSQISSEDLSIPKFLPDHDVVRQDLKDYFAEIYRFDQEVGDLLAVLQSRGLLDRTIIVVTSDNGMPFPHAKANLYDFATRVPLIIHGPGLGIPVSKRFADFVNLTDLTATFLDWAGIKESLDMDGQSLIPMFQNDKKSEREEVFLERERHCLCRAEADYGAGYPMRAIRTAEFLYIRNFKPERWPAGDEGIPGTPSVFGDVDGGPTKMFLMDHRQDSHVQSFFQWGFGRRPAEELYAVNTDPFNLINLANEPAYQSIKNDLATRLAQWMEKSQDPRSHGRGDEIDLYISTSGAWVTRDSLILWSK